MFTEFDQFIFSLIYPKFNLSILKSVLREERPHSQHCSIYAGKLCLLWVKEFANFLGFTQQF